MKQDKLNGSVDVLAQAMRQVFTEAVEGAVEPLSTEVRAMRTEIREVKSEVEGVKADIGATNQNMQAQFAEQEKKIGQMLKGKES